PRSSVFPYTTPFRSGLAVVVSPLNDFVDYLTVAELKTMWAPESQGKITRWNQIRPEWPNRPLNLYGAGTSSGTYDYFTEAINGEAKASRGDYTGRDDDNGPVEGETLVRICLV